MINILIPMNDCGKDIKTYPIQFHEIDGRLVIEHVISQFKNIKNKSFSFVIPKSISESFSFDETLRIISNNNCFITTLESETKGAVCSCLMAIDHIDENLPLIISNSDQVLHCDIEKIINYFIGNDADAGTIVTDSLHPRMSYIKTNSENNVIQASEKKAISRNAIAGFYYFKTAKLFFDAAKNSILKGSHLKGSYYIAPVFNELILKGKIIKSIKISREDYSLFSLNTKNSYIFDDSDNNMKDVTF